MNLREAFDDACSRSTGDNFDKLSVRDQILVSIWGLEADVNNGGFDQYYFNSSGDQAWFAPMALNSIGAHRMAAIVERANAQFGSSGPAPNRDERQSALFRIVEVNERVWEQLDREFYEYPNDIAGLLVTHFGLSADA
jgi:hypothetical protein